MRLRLRLADAVDEPLRTSAAVVAQVWRDGARQARLTGLLRGVDEWPLDPGAARRVGLLLGADESSDVVDASLVAMARDGDTVLTSYPVDIARLAETAGLALTVVRVE